MKKIIPLLILINICSLLLSEKLYGQISVAYMGEPGITKLKHSPHDARIFYIGDTGGQVCRADIMPDKTLIVDFHPNFKSYSISGLITIYYSSDYYASSYSENVEYIQGAAPPLNAGSIAGSQTINRGEEPNPLTNVTYAELSEFGYELSYLWEESSNNSTWSEAVPRTTDPNIFCPLPLEANKYYRRKACDGPLTGYSEPVKITVNLGVNIDFEDVAENQGTLTALVKGGTENYNYVWEQSSDRVNWITLIDKKYQINLTNVFEGTCFRCTVSDGEQTADSNILVWEELQKRNRVIVNTYVDDTGHRCFSDYTYYDGLGYPEQIVNRSSSASGNDMVTPIYYDNMRRPNGRVYLPYVSDNNTGRYDIDPFMEQNIFYSNLFGDTVTYSENIFDTSPLSRIVGNFKVGDAFRQTDNNRKSTYEYLGNDEEEVLHVRVNTQNKILDISEGYKYYEPHSLFKNVTVDEDEKRTEVFVDLQGRTVLERHICDNYLLYDTYYVYDDWGNLCYVLPPELSSGITSTSITNLADNSDAMRQFAYIYKYDRRNRCISKKLPGKEWEYTVYDRADRLIMSQDGNMREEGKWIYMSYDNLGRTLSQSIVSTALTHEDLQERYNSTAFDNSYPVLGGGTIHCPFDDDAATLEAILHEYGYDSYTMPEDTLAMPGYLAFAAVGQAGDYDSRTKGLLTYEKIAVLDGNESGDDTTYLERAYYYDYRGRTVQTVEKNLLGGISRYTSEYDFVGNVLVSHESHTSSGSQSTDTKVTRFTYDHRGRLLDETTVINNSFPAIVSYAYDELGKLVSKTYGSPPDLPSYQPMIVEFETESWLRYDSSAPSDNGAFVRYLYNNIGIVRYVYIDPGEIKIKDGYIVSTDSDNPAIKYYSIPYGGLDAINAALSSMPDSAYSLQTSQTHDYPWDTPPSGFRVGVDPSWFGGPVTETYDYNIQGWLTSQSSELFDMELRYYDPLERDGVTPSWTGNITEWRWHHTSPPIFLQEHQANSYGFTYDGLSRLTANDHLSAASVSAANVDWALVDNGFREYGIDYDLNGNIRTLNRSGFHVDTGSAATDVLAYTYTGNQLASLTHNNLSGSVADAGEKLYSYDANGNMTYDERKGLHFAYNYLNLLCEVSEAELVDSGDIAPMRLMMFGGEEEEEGPGEEDDGGCTGGEGPVTPPILPPFDPGIIPDLPSSYFIMFCSGQYDDRIDDSLTEGFEYMMIGGEIDPYYFLIEVEGVYIYWIPEEWVAEFEAILHQSELYHVYVPSWELSEPEDPGTDPGGEDTDPGEGEEGCGGDPLPEDPTGPTWPEVVPGVMKAQYVWLADGTKLAVTDDTGKGYVYLGSLVYERNGSELKLESTGFGGGRIVASESPYGTEYTPNYQITDHLGSVRVVFTDKENVLARNDYYAFGKKHLNASFLTADQKTNRWLYNGKEMQNLASLGLLDYGARMYDKEIGRWFVIDPMLERRYFSSPYAYCLGNPIVNIDIYGLTDWKAVGRGAKNFAIGLGATVLGGAAIVYSGGTAALLGGGAAISFGVADMGLGITQMVEGFKSDGSPESVDKLSSTPSSMNDVKNMIIDSVIEDTETAGGVKTGVDLVNVGVSAISGDAYGTATGLLNLFEGIINNTGSEASSSNPQNITPPQVIEEIKKEDEKN